MLIGIPEFKEVDFSHLVTRLNSDAVAESFPVSRTPVKFLVAGCLTSILFHSGVFVFYGGRHSTDVMQPVQQRISIHLQVAAEPIAPIESQSISINTGAERAASKESTNKSSTENNDVESILQSEKQIQQINAGSSDINVKVPVVIQPLTAHELRQLTPQNSTGGDASPNGISANVFNPALRQQLNAAAAAPHLQRADAGPKTHTDPSGATVVDLEDGECLRSSEAKLGEAQNWYMTACGGKSESEQIMERVSQAVNGKQTFD